MENQDIASYRLINQHVGGGNLQKPEEIVHYLVAMQAQEYAQTKWSIGLRLPGSSDAEVEEAFNSGLILRTHLMRPTWHFVAPRDIRWLLALTAPRVHALNAYWYKKEGLDMALFKRCHKLFSAALEGGKHMSRNELNEVLKSNKIDASGLRLSYIMMQAELEGLICSGPRKGSQFTYALLDERVAPFKGCGYQECIVEFMRRYFITRGPASVHDFVYWSGLTMKDAKTALPLLSDDFETFNKEGIDYYFKSPESTKVPAPIFLRPDYDEYGMSYKNREAFINPGFRNVSLPYKHQVLWKGQLAGSWQYEVKGKRLTLYSQLSADVNKAAEKALEKAKQEFVRFSGKG